MEKLFQTFLGLQQPAIPKDFHTEHFTHKDYTELLGLWGGGNILKEPTSLANIAEKAYQYEDDTQFFADPDVKMMWRDGLGSFLIGLWVMIAKKKGYNLPEELL